MTINQARRTRSEESMVTLFNFGKTPQDVPGDDFYFYELLLFSAVKTYGGFV